MKRIRLVFSKHRRILIILLLMNIVAFATTQSIANKYSGAKVTQNEDDKIGYIEKGWQIVNWSYNLLKYFKKPHTDTPG